MEGGDCDVGEQFHNYLLHFSEQPYCGVEVPEDLVEELRELGHVADRHMRWGRLVFGWQSSPCFALRMHARVLELAKGDPDDRTSAFCWEAVVLNLPGMEGCDPSLPRVRKVRHDGLAAADLVSFFDDARICGPNQALARLAMRQITSMIQCHGNQDAARKRRPESQRPGAWAGCAVCADQGLVRKFTTQEKWDKTKVHLTWIAELLDTPPGTIPRKPFQSKLGFLVHVAETCEWVKPCLQGFYLSENAWRPNRDAEGWKAQTPDGPSPDPLDSCEESTTGFDFEESARLTGWGLALALELDDLSQSETDDEPQPGTGEDPPTNVTPVPRLALDIAASLELFEGATPTQEIVRPVRGATCVLHGGGDASGEGFGSQTTPLGMPPFWFGKASGAPRSRKNPQTIENSRTSLRQSAKSHNVGGSPEKSCGWPPTTAPPRQPTSRGDPQVNSWTEWSWNCERWP